MSFEDKIKELLTQATTGITDFNPQINSVFVSGLLLPLITVLARQQTYKDLISTSQSLAKILDAQENSDKIQETADAMGIETAEVQAILSTFIENFIDNFDLPRNPAQPSTGLVQLGRDTALAPTDPDSVILVGTQIQTSSGVIFSVTTETTMFAQLGQTYFNSTLNKFIINVPVQAVTPGKAGNVGDDEITLPVGAFPSGLTFVTNQDSFTNGSDEESDPEYIARFLTTFRASNLGTNDGYKSTILSQFPQVSDAFVAEAGSSFLARERGFGGAADIYLLEASLTGTREDVLFDGLILTHTLANQPVIVQIPATDIVITGLDPSSTPFTFVNGTDFVFTEDINALTKRSGRATSFITWLPSGTNPLIGSTYSIFYLFDQNVRTIQDFFDLPEHVITAVDILIREATKVEADIEFSLEVDSGASFSDVMNNVTTEINSFVNELKLGQALTQSRLIEVVEKVDGVSEVQIPFTQFNRSGNPIVVSSIDATSIEYIRIGTLTINES